MDCELGVKKMEEGISFLDLWKVLWKKKILILGTFIFSIVITVCFCIFGIPNQYESKASLMIVMKKDLETMEYEYNNSLILMHSVSQLPKQEIILKKVAEKNNVDIVELVEHITVSIPASSLFLIVTYTSKNPEEARVIANDIVDILIQECKENPDLALIGNSLLKTSNALEAVYVGKNKIILGMLIVAVIMMFTLFAILGKEILWKNLKGKNGNINISNQLENI